MRTPIRLTRFTYDGTRYTVAYDPDDRTGIGAIEEIVDRDAYGLSHYTGLTDPILDVGANIGIAAVILARQNPDARVYAFEPYPPAFDRLVENADRNGLGNLHPVPLAVTGFPTPMATMALLPRMSGANSIVADTVDFADHYDLPATPTMPVNTTTLDRFTAAYRIARVAVLKLDCEGSEYDILRQSTFVTRGYVRALIGEFHDLLYAPTTQERAPDLLAFAKVHIAHVDVSVLRV